MIYTLRGLGTLPPEPSKKLVIQGGLLKTDHQWVRYYDQDYEHQLTTCPKNPPMGCWIVNGYAWGQRYIPGEFENEAPQPLPPPFQRTSPPPTLFVKPSIQAPPIQTTMGDQPVEAPTRRIGGVGASVGIGLVLAIVLTALR